MGRVYSGVARVGKNKSRGSRSGSPSLKDDQRDGREHGVLPLRQGRRPLEEGVEVRELVLRPEPVTQVFDTLALEVVNGPERVRLAGELTADGADEEGAEDFQVAEALSRAWMS